VRIPALVVVTLAFSSCAAGHAIRPVVVPAVVYDGVAFADLDGGLRRGTTYLGTLRFQLTVDGSQLAGAPGMTLYLEGLNIHGGHPSSFAGDAQGVSNLEGPARTMLYEGWIQQNLFRDRLSILAGRYDLNTEFYRLQSAALFLNSSFGMGPEFSQSGRRGPSIFPDTFLAARIEWKPARGVVLRTAILEGGFLVGEGAYLFRPASKDAPRNPHFRLGRTAGLAPYAAKIALGVWHYGGKYQDLSRPIHHQGSGGAYVLTDVTVHRDPARPARRVSLFGQFGIGDARVNRFAGYTGGGLVVSGLVKSRDNDELGVAIAAAHAGGRSGGGSETTLECSYLAPLTSHVAIQPDVQYVLHPGTAKNALVAMLRFELSF
jgi:porin